DAAHDRLADVDVERAAREVVEEEERPRADGEDVVHAHGDEIDADAVVDAGRERDLELGADAVGAAHQDRIGEALRGGAQAGETPDVGDDLGNPRAAGERADAADELVTRVDVDAGLAVRDRHAESSHGTTAWAGQAAPDARKFRRNTQK